MSNKFSALVIVSSGVNLQVGRHGTLERCFGEHRSGADRCRDYIKDAPYHMPSYHLISFDGMSVGSAVAERRGLLPVVHYGRRGMPGHHTDRRGAPPGGRVVRGGCRPAPPDTRAVPRRPPILCTPFNSGRFSCCSHAAPIDSPKVGGKANLWRVLIVLI